jgi:hypothetical protein
MSKAWIFCFLIMTCAYAKHNRDESVHCGTEEHYNKWSGGSEQLSYLQRFILIDKLHAALLKAQRQMIESLLKTSREKRGPQAFRELALFGEKLEGQFNCTDGLSWVEQMTQTGFAFDCGERDCRHNKP